MNQFFPIGAVVALCFWAGTVFAAGPKSLDVRDFGAKGDGLTKDTAAIQKALDACAAGGGGTVNLTDGAYLTGSLVIGANTTLHLDSRSSLVGSPDIADYPLVPIRWEGEFVEGHRALISAVNVQNVGITGTGGIYGPPLGVSRLRNPRSPVLIEFTGCTNCLLDGFTTQYQQMWSIHFLFCQNLTARGLTVRSVSFNGDGLDVDSCSNLTIDRCDINTGDDAISLKSGRGDKAAKLARPTENVVIKNCTLHSSNFAALGIGTEISSGVRNVKIQDCVISGRQNAIFFKSRDGRGGYLENITGENLTILKSPTFIAIDLLRKGIQASDPVAGDGEKWTLMKDVSFNHIRVNDVTELVAAKNIPVEKPVDGLTLSDISGTCTRGISLANMTHVNVSEVNVTGLEGALMSMQNVTGTGLADPPAKN